MGASKEQMQSLYDALAKGDRQAAGTLADSINPTLHELLDRNPNAVMRTAAGLLGDPDRPAREVQWAGSAPPEGAAPAGPGVMQQAGDVGQAIAGQQGEAGAVPGPEMVKNLKIIAPIAASIAGERLGGRAVAPLVRKLATSPQARVLLERAAQGIGGALGLAAPEAIQEKSLAPFASPETAAMAALPMAGTVARRLIPGMGGALRSAGKMAGELKTFSGAADPAVAALTPARTVAESGMTPAPFKPTLTPAMRKELVAMGVPAKALQRLNPKKAAALVEELQAMKQQIGMGERSALMPPPSAVPPAPVAAPPVAPPMQPPVQPPMAAPPPVAAPAAPPVVAAPPPGAAPPAVAAAGPSLEDQLRASLPPEVAASVPPGGAGGGGAPPAAAVPATAAPAAPALTPETIQPQQVQDLVGDVLNHVDMLQGNAPPMAAAVGQGNQAGIAQLLAPFTQRPGSAATARKIGRRSKVR